MTKSTGSAFCLLLFGPGRKHRKWSVFGRFPALEPPAGGGPFRAEGLRLKAKGGYSGPKSHPNTPGPRLDRIVLWDSWGCVGRRPHRTSEEGSGTRWPCLGLARIVGYGQTFS